MPASLLRSVLIAGMAAVMAVPLAMTSARADTARCSDSDGSLHRTCVVPLNKSLILDLPRDAFDVLVSNPGIADAVVRTPRRIYLTGIAVGDTNLFVFDRTGDVIVSLELSIERDISGLEETLARLIPGSNVTVEIINDNVVLSGTVQSAGDSGQASAIAEIFANGGANASQAGSNAAAGNASQGGVTIGVAGDQGSGQNVTSRVINLLSIEGEDQVHLQVTIAEVNRDTVKQLGIDWGLSDSNIGGVTFSNPLTSSFPGVQGLVASIGSISARLQALETEGLVRTLAEPSLTAISGETANFLAGGEFPVIIGTDTDGNPIIEYKPFGVSLDFSPVVLSEGRISLHIRTEVSDLVGTGGEMAVRRAETTLELPSGGSMVMSGLIQDNVEQNLSNLPGIGDIPVLGALFRSREFVRHETELVIIVTPYIVEPTSRTMLATPDQGFNPTNDAAGFLLGQLNRRYGTLDESALRGSYNGNIGFIIQ